MHHTAQGVTPFLAISLVVGLLVPWPSGGSDESLSARLEYSVTPGAYDNAVRVAPITAMLYPRIAIDRSPASPFNGTTYVVGLDSIDCGSLVVIRSRDRAQTFEAPIRSDLCLQGPSVDVVVGRNGTLYVATWGPRILRSTDGGLSWTIAKDLSLDASPASLALDPVSGALYVTWGGLDRPWGPSPGPILLASSDDGGSTWTGPIRILSDASPAPRPQVAAFGGTVVVGFSAPGSPGSSVVAVTSHDGGETWGSPVPVGPPDPCGQWLQPSVAVSDNGIFAIPWSSETGSEGCSAEWGNSTEVWVAISSDGGRTFSGPVRVGGPPAWAGPSFGDAAAFDDAGRLHVAWRSIAYDWTSASVYVATSKDLSVPFESASFETRLREAGGNSTAQENLAPGPDGTMFLAWTVVNPFLGPDDPATGIFVRAVAGEAVGGLATGSGLSGPVEIELRDADTNEAVAHAVWDGSPVVISGIPPDTYPTWIHKGNASALAGNMPVKAWGRTTFSVRIEGATGPSGPPLPWPIIVGLGVAVALVVAAIAVLQYTRLTRENVLQGKIRLLLYEYIRDHPGSPFSSIRDAAGLKNGVAAYHLSVLERQAMVHSVARGRRRLYYPSGVSLWKEIPVSLLQQSILREVERSPGIGVRELARSIGRRASSVGYNVKSLSRQGLLRTARTGAKLRCYPAGDAEVSDST